MRLLRAMEVLSCTTTAMIGAWSRKLMGQQRKVKCIVGDCRQFTRSAIAYSSSKSSQENRSTLLAKTKETFKLADLQWLETKLQSTIRKDQDYTCDRLLIDSNTGSSLYQFDIACSSELLLHLRSGGVVASETNDIHSSIFPRSNIPSSLRRCEWVAEVLHQEATAEHLVDVLRHGVNLKENLDGWTLEYVRMDAAGRPAKEVGYNQKALLCCVSQCIPGHAALNPDRDAQHRLVLVDTTDHGIFLARVFPQLFQLYSGKRQNPLFQVWTRRPFKFSSAINPMVAEMVIDLLLDVLQYHVVNPSLRTPISEANISRESLPLSPGTIILNDTPQKRTLRLLDATCGSGTLLAVGIARDMEVEGWDINPNCVDGCKRNLEHVFTKARFPTNWNVYQHDASRAVRVAKPATLAADHTTSASQLSTFDCVVANLPWGVNTFSYAYENQRILTTLRHGLRAQVPVAIISRTPMNEDLEQLGFQVLGHAHAPQLGFTLPNKKNIRKREEDPSERTAGGECVITVAITT